MNQLTELERKTLNNISRRREAKVYLGDKFNRLIDCVGENGTPVNAVSASEILTISGVSIHGETLYIGDDIYEFLADDAQIKTDPSNFAINIASKTTKSFGTLTITAQPTSGDTLTIGETTYIFVPAGTANSVGEISIGTDLTTAQAAIVAAINGDIFNDPHPLVTASDFAVNACTITALIGGTINNTLVTTETFTASTNVFASATLGSGTNCTAVNTVAAIVDAITNQDVQGVQAVSGTGTTVVLSSKTAGVLGNRVEIETTMANGSFPAEVVVFSGGVDGTVAEGLKFMVDNTYLYVCTDGNETYGKKWRRIALGNAF